MFENVQESVKVCSTAMFSRTLDAQHPVTKNLRISPRFSPTIFNRDANSVLLLAHLCTATIGSMRRTLVRNCHEESVKVYLHNMYNGNVQQNPVPGSRQRECVESCVTKDFSISS